MTTVKHPIPGPLDALFAREVRFFFFTGKGGVGKTSVAASTALALAESGKRVLLVSTDPASNLDEVLGTDLGPRPITVRGSLDALNIDPQAAAARYRDRVVGPLRGVLPESALAAMEEQLSGACTVEIAAFDEFTAFLNDSPPGGYERIVFDTAPTGHTLRLMALSQAWTHFLDHNTSGSSCLGPLAGLEKQREQYANAVEVLKDPARTAIVLVTRPSDAPLREAKRASEELRTLGIANQQLIINGMFSPATPGDPVADAWAKRQVAALKTWETFITGMPLSTLPLRPHNLVGLDALAALVRPSPASPDPAATAGADATEPHIGEIPDGYLPARCLVDDLLDGPHHGVVMTMGKGGVGKTTVAAALALELASRGHRVRLSTTDPAAHLTDTLGETSEHLTVERIDPRVEVKNYVDEVMRFRGPALDAGGRALLEEELRSPCTEEIAVFRAFARTVAAGNEGFVVLDTAPTGHTLLLLDASLAYHRELERQQRSPDSSPEIRQLLPSLRDPAFTRVVLVTLPEATPVHEAKSLEDDLRRAGIQPFAWVVNQSLAVLDTSDPTLAERALGEERYFGEIFAAHRNLPKFVIPWSVSPPVGTVGLADLLGKNHSFHHQKVQPETDMTTYVYETIPSQPGEESRCFEIQQNMSDEPLTAHPETGEPVRRVILGGYGVLKKGETPPPPACGPSCCC